MINRCIYIVRAATCSHYDQCCGSLSLQKSCGYIFEMFRGTCCEESYPVTSCRCQTACCSILYASYPHRSSQPDEPLLSGGNHEYAFLTCIMRRSICFVPSLLSDFAKPHVIVMIATTNNTILFIFFLLYFFISGLPLFVINSFHPYL